MICFTMRTLRLVSIVTFIPFLVCAQPATGIRFEQTLSWTAIKEKAKKENKFIFVDCYATWCGPCKQMGKEIYPLKTVGDYFNEHFVSVKVQMDSTAKDNEGVKKWRIDAHKLDEVYNINAYPTFLFFSPDGQIVHRISAGMNDAAFLQLGKDAIFPEKQNYTLLDRFRKGKRDTAKMKELAEFAKSIGEEKLAGKIAKAYIGNVKEQNLLTIENIKFVWQYADDLRHVQKLINQLMEQLKDDELFKRENLDLVSQFLDNSGTLQFQFFNANIDTINDIMQNHDFVQGAIRGVIRKEEIDSRLWPNGKAIAGEPDWNNLTKTIAEKYNSDYACYVILDSKIAWYGSHKNWKYYTKFLIEKVETYGSNGYPHFYNDNAWIIFERSANRKELYRALSWARRQVKADPTYSNYLDTYANILYKLGKKNEAMRWEKKARQLSPDDPLYVETIRKMEKGEPTWPQ